ncbi:hypothetical protein P0F65_18685 [Sphingomonas sp. I4]
MARTTNSYAMALQAVLHPYGPLGLEVARRTDGGIRLTEQDVRDLVPLVREHETTERRHDRTQMARELGDQAEQLESLTFDARQITSGFTTQVAALSHAHRGSNDLGPDAGRWRCCLSS